MIERTSSSATMFSVVAAAPALPGPALIGLAAEDGVQLDRLALPDQCVQVVRQRHQVGLGRQLVAGVAPVAVGEDAELPAVDELPEALLRVVEVARARPGVARDRLRQRRGRLRVGLQRRDDVDPVERVQVVEVHHVVVHVLRGDHQVADQLRVGRHAPLQRILHRADRGHAVHQRAHAADALREGPGLARVAPLQDELDAAHHRARAPGAADAAVGRGLGLDAQVALDAGDGVDDDAGVHAQALNRPGGRPPAPAGSRAARSTWRAARLARA
jgi:hypothetical protein